MEPYYAKYLVYGHLRFEQKNVGEIDFLRGRDSEKVSLVFSKLKNFFRILGFAFLPRKEVRSCCFFC
jgi:hypothetical protein